MYVNTCVCKIVLDFPLFTFISVMIESGEKDLSEGKFDGEYLEEGEYDDDAEYVVETLPVCRENREERGEEEEEEEGEGSEGEDGEEGGYEEEEDLPQVHVPRGGPGPAAGHEPRAADGALPLQDQEEVLPRP